MDIPSLEAVLLDVMSMRVNNSYMFLHEPELAYLHTDMKMQIFHGYVAVDSMGNTK